MHDYFFGGGVIKKSLKINIVLFILLLINIVFSEKVEALPEDLPKGVERINIENWTKTREVNEVEGDDRKLNTEIINDIENVGIGGDTLQLLSNLYSSATNEMLTVKNVNSNQNSGTENITGNKVLRTIMTTNGKNTSFKVSTFSTWLIGDNSNLTTWKEGEIGTKIITWPCYSKYTNNSQNQGAAEYRMLQGNFNLTNEQITLISRKKVQAVLGVSTNYDSDSKGFETIIPFNDTISVFINNKLTQLHCRSREAKYNSFSYIPERSSKPTIYEYENFRAYDNKEYCNKLKHDYLSSHIEGKHVDLNILNNKISGSYYQMKGDLSKYLETKENNIKLLIGQQIDSIGDSIGGTSKLDLFLIENPQFEVKLHPYFIKNKDKVYLDDKYIFSCGEKIYFDIEIKNTGESFSLDNNDLSISFIVGKDNIESKDILKINKDGITYKNEDITNTVQVYGSDNKTNLSIETLSSIKTDNSIIISSDKINYLVTEYNAIKTLLQYNYVFECNYLDNYFVYRYEGKENRNVNQLQGSLDITVECENNCSDFFHVQIYSDSNSCNLKVKTNNTYKVENLDLNKRYTISVIDSSTHNTVNKETVTLSNNISNSSKYIKLRTSTKSNNYFTERKIEGINR